jgi:hypothetical protein
MALIPGDKEILPWLLYTDDKVIEPIRASSQRGFVAVHQNSPTSIGGGGRNGGSMDKVALISLIGQSIGLVYRPKLIDTTVVITIVAA